MSATRISRRELLLLAASSAMRAATPLFEEVKGGISWTHENGRSKDHYLVNSGPSDFYKPSKPLRNALYKNNRDGTFTDVTAKAGVAGGTFGMGVAVGDYDNDGWPDILVTSYGRCILYH